MKSSGLISRISRIPASRPDVIDVHMHTTASDGTCTPESLVEHARATPLPRHRWAHQPSLGRVPQWTSANCIVAHHSHVIHSPCADLLGVTSIVTVVRIVSVYAVYLSTVAGGVSNQQEGSRRQRRRYFRSPRTPPDNVVSWTPARIGNPLRGRLRWSPYCVGAGADSTMAPAAPSG